jgi:hypothetical protein
MAKDDGVEFVPIDSGLTNHVANRLGLLHSRTRRFFRILVLILISWVPLVILTAISGHLMGRTLKIPLLHDPEANSRFLIALPLLEIAEVFLVMSLGVQVRQLFSSGIVRQQQARVEALLDSIQKWHRWPISELVILIIAIGTSVALRLVIFNAGEPSWEKQSGVITPAGWWHMLVSLPLLYFFLLRAVWLFVLWTSFLLRVSLMDLQLTASHPDHAGGLGFLGWGLASFIPTILAFSTVVSGGFAYEIYHRGETLDSLKYHVIVYVVLVTIFMHLPVIWFAGQLSRCRFRGLLDFSNLVLRHDRSFDEKWIQPQSKNQEKLLGSMDTLSLAGIADGYEHIQQMRFIPWDSKAVMTIAIAAAIPMLPLVGTEIPFRDILLKLCEFLV